MATRKLIVAALCCGLAILLAGGLWLVATAKDDSTTSLLLDIGQSATVGDLVLTVTRAETANGTLTAVVTMALAPEAPSSIGNLAAGWSAISPTGTALTPAAPPPLPSGAPPPCEGETASPGATQECLLFYGLDEGATTSTGYTVVYKGADAGAAWVIT